MKLVTSRVYKFLFYCNTVYNWKRKMLQTNTHVRLWRVCNIITVKLWTKTVNHWVFLMAHQQVKYHTVYCQEKTIVTVT